MGFVDKILGLLGFHVEDHEYDDGYEAEGYVEDEPNYQPVSRQRSKGSRVVPLAAAKRQARVVVVKPQSFDEVDGIADNLRRGRSVVLNVEGVDTVLARRLLDFMSGASYGLGGITQRVGGGVFLFVPADVDVDLQGLSPLLDDLEV